MNLSTYDAWKTHIINFKFLVFMILTTLLSSYWRSRVFRVSLRLVVLLSSSVSYSLYQQRNRHGVMEWKFYVTDDLRDFPPPFFRFYIQDYRKRWTGFETAIT